MDFHASGKVADGLTLTPTAYPVGLLYTHKSTSLFAIEKKGISG
jgi:hypothetical protein